MVKYNNIWTRFGLETLRSNKEFKTIWRGFRVLLVAGLLGIVGDTSNILTGFGMSSSMALALAPFIEKWLRERIPITKI